MSTGSRARIAAAVVAYIILKRRMKKKRCWVTKWIQRREEEGIHGRLLRELQNEDEKFYTNFVRMSPADFEFLLAKISPKIKKQDTHLRKSIQPVERLVLTLRFLASGDSYHSLMHLFRIPVATICKIVPEVCAAIFEELKDEYLKIPSCKEEWLKEADDFADLWDFPHCLGVLDSKHVVIKAQAHSGSTYCNKDMHSIKLIALVNAKYQFTYINLGCNDRVSDAGVFGHCSLSKALEDDFLSFPDANPLPGQSSPIPYFVVSDESFPLSEKLIKPFPYNNEHGPNHIFNYRLSRARRIMENVFGIISVRFRILRRPIELQPKNVSTIVSSICVLHNFLMIRNRNCYVPQGMVDVEKEGIVESGKWRKEGIPNCNLLPLLPISHTNSTISGKDIRENYIEYFMSTEGALPWQNKCV